MKTLPGGVCFDFNGVIVDDERHHCAALIDTLAEDGVTLEVGDFYRDYLGHDDGACFERAFRGAARPLDPATREALHRRKNANYRSRLARDLTLVPGVTDFVVSLLHRESPLAVVSSAPREEIDYVLRAAGLDECFATIVAAEDVTVRKPHPEAYQRAVTLLGLPPARCIAIEDSLIGFASARDAGLPVVMLTTSSPEEQFAAREPAAIWTDFTGRRPEELPWIP